MCTVIVAWQVFPDAPVLVAANRDELLARPTDPPLLLTQDPPRWGGRDRVGGGTWLAVDPGGRVGAVTNRHPNGVYSPPDPSRRSRGGLPLDALARDDVSVEPWMSSLRSSDYNAVNLLYLSPRLALWTGLDDKLGRQVRQLEPGVHVLTEQDPDDPADPKAQQILRAAEMALAASSTPFELLERLIEVLRTHDAAGGASPACIHGEQYGTVSSATVVVTPDGVRYDHAEGPPCRTPHARVL